MQEITNTTGGGSCQRDGILHCLVGREAEKEKGRSRRRYAQPLVGAGYYELGYSEISIE